MKNIILFFCLLLVAPDACAGVLALPTAVSSAAQATNAPPNAGQLPEGQPDKYFIKPADRPISAYKVNYFSANQWLGNYNAQAKFQLSIKLRVLEPNLYIFKHNIFPAYFGYTQKSLWNVGQKSTPFEETNYNPEAFLDYPVNTTIAGRFKLRNIVVSPLEHESNGVAGDQSRSWNRQYILMRFGFETRENLDITNSFLEDKASLYIKLWHATGYEDQTAYLSATGNDRSFLDYMGHGEIGISVRNFLWGGSLRDHQLDIKMPVFCKNFASSFEIQFRQQLPVINFAIYLQYWYGYGETLMRFDQFGHRGFAGLSFSY